MGLDFGGGLFGGESGGFPTPLSNQTALNLSSTGAGGTTMYTVPAGKKFYISSASINPLDNGPTPGNGIPVYIVANSKNILSCFYAGSKVETSTGTFANAPGWTPTQSTFGVPLQLEAGQTITISGGHSAGSILFTVEGWLE